jgi:hypothetical protein
LCGNPDEWIAYVVIGLRSSQSRFPREIAAPLRPQQQWLPNAGWKCASLTVEQVRIFGHLESPMQRSAQRGPAHLVPATLAE